MKVLYVALGFAFLAVTLAAQGEDEWGDYEWEAMNSESTVVPPPSSTTTSTSSSSSSSSSSQPITSSTMNPTSTPPPSTSPGALTYSWNDFTDGNKVCFNLTAVIKVVINETENGVDKTLLNVTLATHEKQGKVGQGSECHIQNTSATIYIVEQNDNAFQLELQFNGTSNSWSFVEVNMLVNGTELELDASEIAYSLSSNLDRNSKNLNSDRSFQCSALDFQFTNTTENPRNITPYVTMTDLKVQVFKFEDQTNGYLGKGIKCAADNSQGNKIVPIAVGAALAGLVIVVLIAYLIGRLRSRKQSSYEALS